MTVDFFCTVDIIRHSPQKWEVSLQDSPVRAFGTTQADAYGRFLAVFELYKEYGENWMTEVLAERNEEYVDEVMSSVGSWPTF